MEKEEWFELEPEKYHNVETVLKQFHKYLKFKDDIPTKVFLGTCASNRLDGEPVWLTMIGAPGCRKTETIRTLGETPNELCYPLSNLTPNTFISGKVGSPDLLPKLDEKIVTIKDFGTILSKEKNTRNEIIGQLREIYDGYYAKETGSGKSTRYHSKFTLIVGTTPIIFRYTSVQTQLGERFLKIIIRDGDREGIAGRASEMEGKEDEMRHNLKIAVQSLLKNIKDLDVPNINGNFSNDIGMMGNILSFLRTPITRDRFAGVTEIPYPEYPTRVVKQLRKLGKGLALINERNEVNEEDLKCLWRVVLDDIDRTRLKTLISLFSVLQDKNGVKIFVKDGKPIETKDVAEICEIDTVMAKYRLTDLMMLGLVEKISEKNYYTWKLRRKKEILNQFIYCLETYGDNVKIKDYVFPEEDYVPVKPKECEDEDKFWDKE